MQSKSEVRYNIIQAVEKVRRTSPMAGSITNTVTINFVANAQLAVGGLAAMVYMPDEGEFLAHAGGAAYINMGTILPVYEKTLPHTARVLHETKKPWVLDPVAVGIGELRTKILRKFKEYKPSVIRGNASEIIALAGLWGRDGETPESRAKGVESTESVDAAKGAAASLALLTGGAVAVSGKIDYITDGRVSARSYGGSFFMEKITGAGCSLGGVMAVYLSVADPFTAALTAHAVYNFAGLKAEKSAAGPGGFQVRFLDGLYNVSAEEIANNPFEVERVNFERLRSCIHS